MNYKTRQHDELIAYLAAVPGHITVNDVCDHFRARGTPIGTTTIYRQLEKMVDAGLVTKYNLEPGSPACFEYVGHGSDETCYHCKCQLCGKLIHMHCNAFPGLQQHIREHHGFVIDPMRTVFYGVCAQCAQAERTDE